MKNWTKSLKKRYLRLAPRQKVHSFTYRWHRFWFNTHVGEWKGALSGNVELNGEKIRLTKTQTTTGEKPTTPSNHHVTSFHQRRNCRRENTFRFRRFDEFCSHIVEVKSRHVSFRREKVSDTLLDHFSPWADRQRFRKKTPNTTMKQKLCKKRSERIVRSKTTERRRDASA